MSRYDIESPEGFIWLYNKNEDGHCLSIPTRDGSRSGVPLTDESIRQLAAATTEMVAAWGEDHGE